MTPPQEAEEQIDLTVDFDQLPLFIDRTKEAA